MVSSKVKALNLPLAEVIVIGSGLLDELGLREAGDIDLAISKGLYASLKASGEYQESRRNNGSVLERGNLEIWTGWGDVSFETLLGSCQSINGVNFVSTQFLLGWKVAAGRLKDAHDIQLIEGYYGRK